MSSTPSATAWSMPSGEVISITIWAVICASAHSASTIFIPKAITDRHEYERRPTEILHPQARLWQGYHIYTGDGFVR